VKKPVAPKSAAATAKTPATPRKRTPKS
jgi:hypothetical protein